MNTEQKSLKLAELMGWEVSESSMNIVVNNKILNINVLHDLTILNPYADTNEGKAQFAAILLRFPDVMIESVDHSCVCGLPCFRIEPTQANILDEILRMNGIDPEGEAL